MRSLHAFTLSLATVVGVSLPLLLPAAASAAPCSGVGSGVTATTDPSAAPSEGSEFAPMGRKPATADTPPAAPAPQVGAQTATTATRIGWVTGPRQPNQTDTRFGISGTDLGIMWDNGAAGAEKQVLIAYGDTFGDCSLPGDEWRFNTLMRSTDADLSDGLTVPDPAPDDLFAGSPVTAALPDFSRQIIDSLGLAPTEFTVIPTAGVSVAGVQYINFMSVRAWGNPGQWTTNFSAIAVSNDNGETWEVDEDTIRTNQNSGISSPAYITGNNNFQMAAYAKHDGYLYTFGTPSGRFGSARVARVAEGSLLDLDAYEYWNGTTWVLGQPGSATNVLTAPVSELSVQYNEYLDKFVALYTNSSGNVVLRTADEPQGPWSAAETIVSAFSIPGGLYAPYIHPWSTGNELYFTLSLWSDYNVMLMRTTLSTDPAPGTGSMGGS